MFCDITFNMRIPSSQAATMPLLSVLMNKHFGASISYTKKKKPQVGYYHCTNGGFNAWFRVEDVSAHCCPSRLSHNSRNGNLFRVVLCLISLSPCVVICQQSYVQYIFSSTLLWRIYFLFGGIVCVQEFLEKDPMLMKSAFTSFGKVLRKIAGLSTFVTRGYAFSQEEKRPNHMGQADLIRQYDTTKVHSFEARTRSTRSIRFREYSCAFVSPPSSV